jgi:hypothetical protein
MIASKYLVIITTITEILFVYYADCSFNSVQKIVTACRCVLCALLVSLRDERFILLPNQVLMRIIKDL